MQFKPSCGCWKKNKTPFEGSGGWPATNYLAKGRFWWHPKEYAYCHFCGEASILIPEGTE